MFGTWSIRRGVSDDVKGLEPRRVNSLLRGARAGSIFQHANRSHYFRRPTNGSRPHLLPSGNQRPTRKFHDRSDEMGSVRRTDDHRRYRPRDSQPERNGQHAQIIQTKSSRPPMRYLTALSTRIRYRELAQKCSGSATLTAPPIVPSGAAGGDNSWPS